MTLADLTKAIEEARWFESLGAAQPRDGITILKSINDWNRGPEWDWLPSSNDQKDPFHTDDFNDCRTNEEKEIFRFTLKATRNLPSSVPGLRSTPHDFTQAARNAATFAARMAARELVLNFPEKWQSIILLYRDGFWPCGKTKDAQIVVL